MPVYEAIESEFEMVPEGDVVAAKVTEIKFEELEFGPRLNWIFEITEEGEYKGWKLRDGTSPKFSIDPASKLYEWACVLLGRTFELGEMINTDYLIGLPCRIEVGHRADSRNKDLPEDKWKFWMRVDTLMPARGTSVQSAEEVFGG